MSGLLKFISLTLLVAGLGMAILCVRFLNEPLNLSEEGLLFELSKGESLGHLANKLAKQGVIEHPFMFKLYGQLVGADKSLKAGEYFFERGIKIPELFRQLNKGGTFQRSITFVEGWTQKELFNAIKQNSNLRWDTDEESLLQTLDLESDSLEGMFFADTYFFSKNQSARNLLIKSHEDLERVLIEEWESRNENLPLKNSYQALILASIVEKETGLASERPLIAGVFINRLNAGMRLQTDPTVIYGLGESYQGNLTKLHLQTYTPYNTYRIPALPPTPIAMVGRESIHAVLHPEESDYLYFVAKGDGSHFFSSTLEQHQSAVKEYQWKRVNNYRSAPVAN